MKIPKIIHQIYDCPAGVPEVLLQISETWKTEHPGWQYRLWNSEAIDEFLQDTCPQFIPTYKSFLLDRQRWDSLRYLILYHVGGLYVDTDYSCLQPMDNLLGAHTCCFGLEPTLHATRFGKQQLIGNAMMATVPSHPFFMRIINQISIPVKRDQRNTTDLISETTGIKMLHMLYDDYDKKHDIQLLPAELIAPLSAMEMSLLLTDRETPEMEDKVENAYALHYFLGQWRLKTPYYRYFNYNIKRLL